VPLLVAAALAVPSAARAQGVTFDDAIGLADATPAVRAEERALEARRSGDARISDVTEASRIFAMPGVRAIAEEDAGFEGQIQLGHSWNLAGLADAQRRTARQEREAREARARAVALAQRLLAARAWMSLREAEAHLVTARDALAIAERVLERTQRAAAASVATRADVAEAQAYVSESRAAVLAVQGEIVDAQVDLGAALGRADVETLTTAGEIPAPAIPDPAEIERLLTDVEHIPEVVAARLSALATRAREAEVAAQRGPRLDADVIVYRESPNGLMIFGQVGVNLPFADLAARERSVVQEEAELREGEAEEAALSWQREAHRVAHEVEHTAAVAASFRTELVPSLEALLTAREQQLTAGETTVLIVLDATRRLVLARAALTRADTEHAWAATRAWLLLAVRARGEATRRAEAAGGAETRSGGSRR
jgi:cobalt-zinc-cadmium efflux system outer membrane protein